VILLRTQRAYCISHSNRAAESELLNSRRDRSRLLWICAQKSSGQAKAHWCRLCTKVFDTKSSLQSHAARRHFEQQALACGDCDEQIGPADTVAANVAASASSLAIMDAKVSPACCVYICLPLTHRYCADAGGSVSAAQGI
jgi:hypothetical protein